MKHDEVTTTILVMKTAEKVDMIQLSCFSLAEVTNFPNKIKLQKRKRKFTIFNQTES